MTGVTTTADPRGREGGDAAPGAGVPARSGGPARGAVATCRALLAVKRSARGRRLRKGSTGVLYLLETGGPGGAERMLLDLARHIAPWGRPVVGVMRSGWLQAHATAAGIPCVTTGGEGLGDVGVLRTLAAALVEYDIDVIHAHEFYMALLGTMLSAATGVPLVVTVHGKHYYPERWRRRAIYWLVARRAAALVAVSEELRRYFCAVTHAPPDRVRVVYNGIERRASDERGARTGLLESAGIPASARIVGTVGSLYPVKGHLDLLRAVAAIQGRCPTAHVVIAGQGPLREALLAEAAKLGIAGRVHLLGYRDDARAWLTTMDAFAMPSRSEGLPLSLLEAMDAGLPAVVTAVGGMPEVVADGRTGFVVPAGATDALADRLCFLLENPETAARMGTAARDEVTARFGVDRMVAEYQDLYLGATARRHRPERSGQP